MGGLALARLDRAVSQISAGFGTQSCAVQAGAALCWGDNTFAQNDIGIAVSINASLALKAAVQVRHNTEVPVGTERTDTLTSVNIVWSPKAD